MHTSKVGGMGGYAEYRFGRAGNFLSNFCYTISLIIANAAIASGVVSYGSYVFGLTLSPVEVCMATIGVLILAATISLVGPKKFGKFSSLGVFVSYLQWWAFSSAASSSLIPVSIPKPGTPETCHSMKP